MDCGSDNRPLKIAIGPYGKWANEFIPPDTPEGKLLSMGIKAIPVLIDSLADKSLSDSQRAWILVLLFSATGQNDPRQDRVLVRINTWRRAGRFGVVSRVRSHPAGWDSRPRVMAPADGLIAKTRID